jgi:hypothetical protein
LSASSFLLHGTTQSALNKMRTLPWGIDIGQNVSVEKIKCHSFIPKMEAAFDSQNLLLIYQCGASGGAVG